MKRAHFLLIAVLTVAICQPTVDAGTSLKPGKSFPIIEMPDSQSGELKSIADFRGEKLMLQIFASW